MPRQAPLAHLPRRELPPTARKARSPKFIAMNFTKSLFYIG